MVANEVRSLPVKRPRVFERSLGVVPTKNAGCNPPDSRPNRSCRGGSVEERTEVLSYTLDLVTRQVLSLGNEPCVLMKRTSRF